MRTMFLSFLAMIPVWENRWSDEDSAYGRFRHHTRKAIQMGRKMVSAGRHRAEDVTEERTLVPLDKILERLSGERPLPALVVKTDEVPVVESTRVRTEGQIMRDRRVRPWVEQKNAARVLRVVQWGGVTA